jgi:peptidoglycan/LPS O-acetylase OafA/YrhL
MFGAFRFLLAVMVVITHLGGVEIVAGVAVWGFFMLSGFLMTAVLNKKYHFDAGGLGRFAISRGLRLFPTYWLTLLLTLAVFALPSYVDPRDLNHSWGPPEDFGQLAANILIVGHTVAGIGRVENALSPSAWAIDVEILMYVCSAVWLARSPRAAKWTSIVLILAYPLLWAISKKLAAAGHGQTANELLYSFLPAALLPYAIGSWLWQARQRLPAILTSPLAAAAGVAGALVCIFGVARVSVTAGYLLAVPCVALIMAALSRVRLDDRRARIDTFLGLMAYPIYLLHWLCGYLVMVLLPPDWNLFVKQGEFVVFTPEGFAMGALFTLALSALFAWKLEAPIEQMRHRFAKVDQAGTAT